VNDSAIDILRDATRGTEYENRLYLVGGVVRDRLLGIESDEDVDIVIEGNAEELAGYLYERGIAEHPPATYPRFRTAMVCVCGRKVEIVGARRESYAEHSRKPDTLPGILLDDVMRRDFTINTLLENLHSHEMLDLTGHGISDLREGVIRTPKEPEVTFHDDPLRMLRAVRFAVRFNFRISPETLQAIGPNASRLVVVSAERIRDEFIKIIMSPRPALGMELLRGTGLLEQFAPELVAMHGVQQNIYHIYDVWTHTMRTLESISAEEGIILRIAALYHDVGKAETRSIGEDGQVHFYRHQIVGAEIARRALKRLRFSRPDVDHVAFLISMHLRVGEYDTGWSDAAIRRLIRDAGSYLDELVKLTKADKAAANPNMPKADMDAFEARVKAVHYQLAGKRLESPLSGREIMDILGLQSGPAVGEAKAYLEHELTEGTLLPGDKSAAIKLLLHKYGMGNGAQQNDTVN